MPNRSMFSDDTAFRTATEETLEALLDQIDEIDADIDPRVASGSLTVQFEDGSVLMLSPQTPTHELWLSANYTAWHFLCEEAGAWIERDTGASMLSVLSTLFSEKLNEAVRFTL
ncbi:MAG: iron donor protein CyaY [Myxococcota bacterium]